MNDMSTKTGGNTVAELKEMVKKFKAHAMTLSSAAGSGHVGGAMSSAEWIIPCWFEKLNIDNLQYHFLAKKVQLHNLNN